MGKPQKWVFVCKNQGFTCFLEWYSIEDYFRFRLSIGEHGLDWYSLYQAAKTHKLWLKL